MSKASLVRLERGKTPEALSTAITELEKAVRAPQYASLRRAFTVWINRVVLRKGQIKEPMPEFNDLQEINAMLAETVTQWTQQWKMEGMLEGEARGRTEGRTEGESKGRHTLMTRLLTRKFGTQALTPALQQRMQSATIDQLDHWGERLLDAQSVDEVFWEN